MTNQSDFILIKEVLDKYFSFQKELGDGSFAAMTKQIPKVMLDKNKKPDSDWSFWLPIDSTITDKEITELEKLFKQGLPDSFKYFLKQKHFVELNLGQNPRFFSVLPNKLVKKYKDRIDNFYWTLLDRNYLPFADYSDWGVLCFNANIATPTNDYEIVILDHDDNYQKQELYSSNFLSLFELLGIELDETIMQVREHKKNNA